MNEKEGLTMGEYIYESHMGGLYTSERELTFEELYCDECGDSDWCCGYAANREEAREIIENMEVFDQDYIDKFLDEEFPEEG